MSEFIKCTICKEYHWINEKCKPIYFVNYPDYHGDEWQEVRANSHKEAAENYCDWHDSQGDYDIIGDGGLDEIFIKDAEGVVKKFSVDARAEPTYSATELE